MNLLQSNRNRTSSLHFAKRGRGGKFMKRIELIIIIGLLLTSCSNRVDSKTEITQQVLIADTLTENGIGCLVIGKSFYLIRSEMKNYKLEYIPDFGGYKLYIPHNNLELFLSVINDTLEGVTVSKGNVVTKSGLHIGTQLSKFRSIYPTIPIQYDNLNEAERFCIKNKKTTLELYVQSNNEERILGNYEETIYDTSLNYDLNGKIISMSIYSNSIYQTK